MTRSKSFHFFHFFFLLIRVQPPFAFNHQPPSASHHHPRPMPSASNVICIRHHPRQRPATSPVSFFLFFFFLSIHPHPTPSAHYIDSRQSPSPPHVSFFLSFFCLCTHSRQQSAVNTCTTTAPSTRVEPHPHNVSATHCTHPHGKYDFIGYELLLTLFFLVSIYPVFARRSTRLHANTSTLPRVCIPARLLPHSARQHVCTPTRPHGHAMQPPHLATTSPPPPPLP